ncbi:MAG: hypothetical protein Hyperionvirus2_176 [Hyperionvirus sp.]|uniref:Chromosome condensation regulator n=1 Tax=Hyperionvirus sp. TaxID=2487770 RepID=A0A3G5A6K3_9VIRU|nr:MAG: hypothetical protein Hyperionvirus2_176 [Hyperionvirus sp.]
MDANSLVRALPVDLQWVVSSYDPGVLFWSLSVSELAKYDWFRMVRMNFALSYARESSSNEDMMKVYLDNCCNERSRIACGGSHVIVRLRDRLMGCGSNLFGQLGLGDIPDRSLFEEIVDVPKNIAEVVCGLNHTIVRLTDGTLMGCGHNWYGQLGLGDCDDRNLFCEIKGIPKNILKVVCGEQNTVILLTDFTIMSCGCGGSYNAFSLRQRVNRFVKIDGIPKNIRDVVCTASRTIVLLTDFTLVRFGYHGWAEPEEPSSKIEIESKQLEISKNILEIKCSLSNIIVLTDSVLMGCGRNMYGQLGLGDNGEKKKFSMIKGINNISKVICSPYHTILKLDDGTLMSSGNNSNGQLGLGDQRGRNIFEEIKGIPKTIVEVICGENNTILRLRDGTLMICGSNSSGQLGQGDNINRGSFVEIKGIEGI